MKKNLIKIFAFLFVMGVFLNSSFAADEKKVLKTDEKEVFQHPRVIKQEDLFLLVRRLYAKQAADMNLYEGQTLSFEP